MTDKKPLLIADNISYELPTTRTLFKNVRLSINQGERIALVGANGVGKSSLLKILAGEIQPNYGSVARDGVIYYLPQINTITHLHQETSVLEFLTTFSEEWWEIANQLEITKAFKIKEKSLQPMIYLPEETDEFYRELIN